MNARQRNRRDLRNRLQNAQFVILRRQGWSKGNARRMAREKADAICKQVKQQ